MQREEELARLQEENAKLRQFLNSSFVKNLEEKAKLCVDGRRKRTLSSVTDPVSKRVCRNLTAEFSSESETSEPNLDLWVLRTLGLKDKDTIDTTTDDRTPVVNGLLYDSAAADLHLTSVSSEFGLNESQEPEESGFNDSSSNLCSDFSASALYDSTGFTSTTGQTPPEQTYFSTNSPNTSFLSSEKSSCLEQNPAGPWSSSLQTTSLLYSPSERLRFCPVSCSTPVSHRGPRTPQARPGPELAFSMCLSPSSSVKTHSFPQGQAFVRRESQGRCNFTWVPKERP